MQAVVIDKVSKHFGAYHALKEISLAIERGEFIVIVGPSGCGKSTLLRTLAGLEEVSNGQIVIEGNDVTWVRPGDRGIAMVFQNYALYPHMTVAQNMGYGLRLAGHDPAAIRAAVGRASAILKLDDHLDKLPSALSGGQRQRVAIGRAITRSPKVFLFDEPLSNLDAALRTRMRVEIAALHRSLGVTTVYVTHDQVEAMTMADRIVAMNGGRIEQVGAPLDLYRNPVNRFVAGFLGSPRMNFVSARIAAIDGGAALVSGGGLPPLSIPLRGQAAAGQLVTLGVRPEHLVIGSGACRLEARARHLEHLGRETILFAVVDGLDALDPEGGTGSLTLQTSQTLMCHVDEPLTIGFEAEDVLLFDADGQRLDLPRQ